MRFLLRSSSRSSRSLHLRSPSFIDNCISKIEGLLKCKLLEELSVEKNKITKIEGLSHLQ